MGNLTITIDDRLLKQARMRALEDGTSVNALLRTYLERYAGVGDTGEALTEFARLAEARQPVARKAASGRVTTSMTEPIFVDTNVWVYAVDAADPVKRSRALEVTAPALRRDLVISTQVLTEFYAVVTRKLAKPVSMEGAEAMVRQLSALPVVAIDGSLVVAAVAASRQWQISIWDALIVRAAEIAGCRRVLSEDLGDGTTYGSVVVENPFSILR
jgi:predicted nucleic acid-binding protein